MIDILLALYFLTRIPIPLKREFPARNWARSMAWYPFVGLLVGFCLAAGQSLMMRLWAPDLAAVLTLVIWVGLTGGLHLDGFVDCCDALPVALSPERRLEILRDVHVGTYGVVGAVLLLTIKAFSIRSVNWAGLVLAPILGRWAMVVVTLLFPYARPSGLGKAFKDHIGRRELIIATSTALLAAVLLGQFIGLVVMGIGFAIAWILGLWSARQLGGGITGDVYGFVCELVELSVMLAWIAIRP